jgi:putative endonuclease
MAKKTEERSLGDAGEAYAAGFLKKAGYRVLETNFRDRAGEIDVIALDGGTVCFIEVKTRRSEAAGGPEEAVDPRKVRRIVRASQAYRAAHRLHDTPVRFDVLAVRVQEDGSFEGSLTKGAFYEDGWG